MFSPLIDKLINRLRYIPGIGPKSAQRITFYFLNSLKPNQQSMGLALSDSLKEAIKNVKPCQRCRMLSELPLCMICSDAKRNQEILCVVETPTDVIAIEQTQSYKGYYFVLMGRLSPLEGTGVDQLGIKEFLEHIKEYQPKEVILATSSTAEGETTAHYLHNLLQGTSISVSRIAHGIPLGNELEFVDSRTLMQALLNRKAIDN